jgi:hypothetical protein
MLDSNQIRKRLGHDVVAEIEDAVRGGLVSAWSEDVNSGQDALEQLLVRMLASVLGTGDRTLTAPHRARHCAAMLIQIADNLPHVDNSLSNLNRAAANLVA